MTFNLYKRRGRDTYQPIGGARVLADAEEIKARLCKKEGAEIIIVEGRLSWDLDRMVGAD